MRAAKRVTQLTALLALAACSGDDADIELNCTLELRAPVQVRISSPEGLVADSVTVRNQQLEECQSSFVDAGADVETYHCFEQGGGTYRVRVRSGDLSWSQSVELHSNGCHVTDRAELEFSLEAASAD